MDPKALMDLQSKIVVAVADGIKSEWQFAVVNIEIDLVDGEQTENCLCLSLSKAKDEWSRRSFDLPFQCYDMFLMLRDKTDEWKTCMLEFDLTGKYRFSFSSSSPKRLNGIHNEESLLSNYIPPPL